MTPGHGFTGQQCLRFLDGSLPAAEAAALQAHLDSCPACRRLHDDLVAWETSARREAESIAAAFHRRPSEIERMAAVALRRLRHLESQALSRAELRFGENVLLLRALLDPICGAGAARNAVRLATAQSFTSAEQDLSAAHWRLFVKNLGAAVGAVYGEPARALTEKVGELVVSEVR